MACSSRSDVTMMRVPVGAELVELGPHLAGLHEQVPAVEADGAEARARPPRPPSATAAGTS